MRSCGNYGVQLRQDGGFGIFLICFKGYRPVLIRNYKTQTAYSSLRVKLITSIPFTFLDEFKISGGIVISPTALDLKRNKIGWEQGLIKLNTACMKRIQSL